MLTKQAIRSLFKNTDPDSYTLTVLDDGSDEETATLLRCLTVGDPVCHLVRNDQPSGVGGARNRCIAESEQHFGRGDYLYLSDNDVVFTPGWLEKLTRAYSLASQCRTPFRVIGGYAHPYNGTVGEPIHLVRCEHGVNSGLVATEDSVCIHEKYAVDGVSWLLDWNTWYSYGKFCDNVTDRRSSEDHEWCQRVRREGYGVGVVYPHVVLNCGKTDSWGGTIPGADVAIKEVEGVLVQ